MFQRSLNLYLYLIFIKLLPFFWALSYLVLLFIHIQIYPGGRNNFSYHVHKITLFRWLKEKKAHTKKRNKINFKESNSSSSKKKTDDQCFRDVI